MNDSVSKVLAIFHVPSFFFSFFNYNSVLAFFTSHYSPKSIYNHWNNIDTFSYYSLLQMWYWEDDQDRWWDWSQSCEWFLKTFSTSMSLLRRTNIPGWWPSSVLTGASGWAVGGPWLQEIGDEPLSHLIGHSTILLPVPVISYVIVLVKLNNKFVNIKLLHYSFEICWFANLNFSESFLISTSKYFQATKIIKRIHGMSLFKTIYCLIRLAHDPVKTLQCLKIHLIRWHLDMSWKGHFPFFRVDFTTQSIAFFLMA